MLHCMGAISRTLSSHCWHAAHSPSLGLHFSLALHARDYHGGSPGAVHEHNPSSHVTNHCCPGGDHIYFGTSSLRLYSNLSSKSFLVAVVLLFSCSLMPVHSHGTQVFFLLASTLQVKLEDHYNENWQYDSCLYVDGVDFFIKEMARENPWWYSHNYNGPGHRYEIAKRS